MRLGCYLRRVSEFILTSPPFFLTYKLPGKTKLWIGFCDNLFTFADHLLPPPENEPYDAERHLAIGTPASAEILADLEYDWYTNDEPHTAGTYASRAVFPFLLTGNLRDANKAFSVFTSRLLSSESSKVLNVQQVSSQSADVRVFPSLPILNFTSLLLLAIQRGTTDLFRQLTRQYAIHIREVDGLESALAHIGELYFGIKIPKQSNPLMDMMGMMFGGGGAGAKPARQQRTAGKAETQPLAMDLD